MTRVVLCGDLQACAGTFMLASVLLQYCPETVELAVCLSFDPAARPSGQHDGDDGAVLTLPVPDGILNMEGGELEVLVLPASKQAIPAAPTRPPASTGADAGAGTGAGTGAGAGAGAGASEQSDDDDEQATWLWDVGSLPTSAVAKVR